MTISTTTSRQSYNGNGVTTIFSVPFRFFANSDLVVQLVTVSTGASTTLTLTTHYTVTGADEEAGGSLTMLTAPAVGERLVIRRVIGATQEVDYVAGDPFPAETHERALDRLTMLAQQGEEVNARALVFPSGDTANGELPEVATRANKLLGFDSSGGLVVSAPASGSAAELALDLASTASGKGAEMVGFDWAPLPSALNNVDFGIKTAAHGVNVLRYIPPSQWAAIISETSTYDATADFAAFSLALTGGKSGFMPKGKYRADEFAIPDGVSVHAHGATIERNSNTANPLVSCGDGVTLYGLTADGREGAGLTAASNREQGIAAGNDCLILRCRGTRNRGHGIGNKSVAIDLQYSNITIVDSIGDANGVTPGPSGTGDGIGLVNVSNGKIVRCRGIDNARSGITATTYDTGTLAPDAALSVGVEISSCTVSGNGYEAAINCEYVTGPVIKDNTADGFISFSHSPDAKLADNKSGGISSISGDYPKLSGNTIASATKSYELLSLTGASPILSDNRVTSTAGSPTLNLVQILPSDSKGSIDGLVTVGGNHAMRLDLPNIHGLSVSGQAGTALILGSSGSTRSFPTTELPEMYAGKLVGWGTADPTSGLWNQGDTLRNRAPVEFGSAPNKFTVASRVCVSTGSPGTWVQQRTLTGN